ncbi:MAG TPA: rhodanese-like domain-containing protein [Gallionella sp.]
MKSNQSKIIWVLAIMFGVLFASQQLQASEGVDARQAQSMGRQGAMLLDVREPAEYAEVHAANVKLIPLGQLGSRLQEIAAQKDQPIVVMCRSGRRSAKAVSLLQEAGFTKVSNMSGGMMAWEDAGLEVIRGR